MIEAVKLTVERERKIEVVKKRSSVGIIVALPHVMITGGDCGSFPPVTFAMYRYMFPGRELGLGQKAVLIVLGRGSRGQSVVHTDSSYISASDSTK
jgi:hypothetical protein